MILRPYQAAASNAIFKEWQENDSTLVVMPTGGGKTVLFADVIRRVFPRRALVIVSSIQTQCSGGDGGGRMSKFDPQRFGLLIIDEAHHAT